MSAASHYEIPFDQGEVFKRVCLSFPALFDACKGSEIGVAIRIQSAKSLQCLFGYGLSLSFLERRFEEELVENFGNEDRPRWVKQSMESLLYFAATNSFSPPSYGILCGIAKKIDIHHFNGIWAIRGEHTASPVRRFEEEQLRIVTFHRALEQAYSPEWNIQEMPVVMQSMLHRSGLIDLDCMSREGKKKVLSEDLGL